MLSVRSVVTFVKIELSREVATIPIYCSSFAIYDANGSDFVTWSFALDMIDCSWVAIFVSIESIRLSKRYNRMKTEKIIRFCC